MSTIANAVACEIDLTVATSQAVSYTPWKPSLGASVFVAHGRASSGTFTVELQACNLVTETPKTVLTIVSSSTSDIFAEMATGLRYPYRYWRLKCTAFAAGVGRVVATGVR